jgi:arginine decarboxylase
VPDLDATLVIAITSGTGEAKTELAAFDAALCDAGIGGYNIICMSSVIPAGSQLVRSMPAERPEEFGNRLYVVLSKALERTKGRSAWAGLGWIRDRSTGCGLLVEHSSGTEEDLLRQIRDSLNGVSCNRRWTDCDSDYVTTGVPCKGDPVCAVVAAVFWITPWLPPPT